MNEFTQFAEEIKARVTMQDAISLYAPNPAPRFNRIPCPIHNGDNYNLHFKDNLYYCHVCHDGGDIIKFVQHIFKIDFRSAVRKLNDDFSLALLIDRRATLREQREADRKYNEILAERARRDAEKQAHDTLYAALWDEFARLDKQRREHFPNSADDELHPLYVEAITKISNIEYCIDTLL